MVRTSTKRGAEDTVDAPPAKRGRGRPTKASLALEEPSTPTPKRGRPLKDPNPESTLEKRNGIKRGPGRPPKVPNAEPKSPKPRIGGTGRPRGRPPKNPNAEPALPKSKVLGRGRGRPPKDSAARPVPHKPKVPGRGRGRPRKDPDAGPVPRTPKVPGRGRGRPKKDAGTPVSVSKNAPATPATKSKPGAKLTDIIGTYEITCEAVGDWPDRADDLSLAISTLPGINSTLIGSFDLGILEGTMLFAADEATLQRAREQMTRSNRVEPNKKPAPAIKDRRVYFSWQGRDVGDTDEVHPDRYGNQIGHLTFADAKCEEFAGVGAFPALGEDCTFSGTMIDEAVYKEPKPWNHFSEAAYEEANRRRWG